MRTGVVLCYSEYPLHDSLGVEDQYINLLLVYQNPYFTIRKFLHANRDFCLVVSIDLQTVSIMSSVMDWPIKKYLKIPLNGVSIISIMIRPYSPGRSLGVPNKLRKQAWIS